MSCASRSSSFRQSEVNRLHDVLALRRAVLVPRCRNGDDASSRPSNTVVEIKSAQTLLPFAASAPSGLTSHRLGLVSDRDPRGRATARLPQDRLCTAHDMRYFPAGLKTIRQPCASLVGLSGSIDRVEGRIQPAHVPQRQTNGRPKPDFRRGRVIHWAEQRQC